MNSLSQDVACRQEPEPRKTGLDSGWTRRSISINRHLGLHSGGAAGAIIARVEEQTWFRAWLNNPTPGVRPVSEPCRINFTALSEELRCTRQYLSRTKKCLVTDRVLIEHADGRLEINRNWWEAALYQKKPELLAFVAGGDEVMDEVRGQRPVSSRGLRVKFVPRGSQTVAEGSPAAPALHRLRSAGAAPAAAPALQSPAAPALLNTGPSKEEIYLDLSERAPLAPQSPPAALEPAQTPKAPPAAPAAWDPLADAPTPPALAPVVMGPEHEAALDPPLEFRASEARKARLPWPTPAPDRRLAHVPEIDGPHVPDSAAIEHACERAMAYWPPTETVTGVRPASEELTRQVRRNCRIYPSGWFLRVFKRLALQGTTCPRWAYVKAILDRWDADGGPDPGDEDLFDDNLKRLPGRPSPGANRHRQRYVEESPPLPPRVKVTERDRLRYGGGLAAQEAAK